MQPRTKNERFLLVLLILVAIGIGSYLGYDWLSKRQAALHLTYVDLLADQAEAQADLKESNLWKARMNWVKTNEPTLDGSEDDSKAEVLNYVLKGARDHKLEIVEQNLGDVQHGPGGTRVNVTVKVKGPMQDLVEWLCELQKPDSFYAIGLLSLKVDQDQKSMLCSLQVARFFKPASS